ncbi:bacteriophage protein [Mycobacterium marinum]|uniref:HNH endonuclease n=1 Tax=Mycobacterium marinum TaxID=1781 RepID=UPI00235B33FB|nr:bacteriophage protein [Mycobacterium marinum]
MPRAPKLCGRPGCVSLVRGRTYCPEHTVPWARSTWKKPIGWDATRARILKRDRGICYICRKPEADEVDHIHNQARGGADNDNNLAAIHKNCHKEKTKQDRWQR